MKAFIISIFVIALIGCTTKAVLFGNHDPNHEENFHRIFMDQYGDYYPEMQVDNSIIKSNEANLSCCYEQSPKYFFSQFQSLGLDTKNPPLFSEFQDALIRYHADQINKKMVDYGASTVTFIMVGFNNQYSATLRKLKDLREQINLLLKENNKKTFVVELYWDGKMSIFGADIISIFDNAQANSYNAGIQLRLLLNKLNAKDIYLVSHSLGANVITECLFNQSAKIQDDRYMGEYSVYKYVHDKYTDKRYLLDKSKKYHAALIAPAIPGSNTFVDYSERGGTYNKSDDNYMVISGININDIVLNKVIRKTTLFGATSFGCRYSELNDVFTMFNKEYDRNKIDTVDFSIRNNKKHRAHGIDTYRDMPEYNRMLKKLYEIK